MKRHWKSKIVAMAVTAELWAMAVPAQEPAAVNESGAVPAELRGLVTDGMAAGRAKDEKKLKEIARNLMIPDHELWFKTIFKEEFGARMGAAYEANAEQAEKSCPKIFSWLSEQEGELLFEDIKSVPQRPDNWCAQALVNAEKENVAIYRVGVRKTNSSGPRLTTVAGYFTLVDGAYRRLDCQIVGLQHPTTAPGGAAPNGPVRVAGHVQAAMILKKVVPEYPADARASRISGTVRLHALIGRDGRIKKLEVVSGHPMLQDAALHAVSQWVYRPTLLNGEPVLVDTTIDVIFTLNW